MLNAIKQKADDYYNALPNNISKTVVASALFSFTISILFAKKPDGIVDISRAMTASAIAGTASLIHAIVTPIFKEILGSWHVDYIGQWLQMSFVTVTTSALLHAVSKTPSMTFPIYSAVSMNWFRALFQTNLQNNNSEYIYINT